MKASSIGNECPLEATARSFGPHSANHASRSGSSHSRCSGSRSAMRSATRLRPAPGIMTSVGFTGSRLLLASRAFPTFAPRPDMAHARLMTSRNGAHPARRSRVRRLMLRDFRSYAALDLAIEGRLVVLCGENGAGKTNLLEAVSLLG